MLDQFQEKFINYFAKTALAQDFYWAGGTALAEHYLHHRLSQDLDFFTDKNVDYEQLIKLVGDFGRQNQISDIDRERIFDRRIFLMKKDAKLLKLEFAKYDFPLLNPLQIEPKTELKITSLDDLAAGKLMALIDRNEPKDVVDIYYLLQRGKYTLEKIIKLVKKKFGLGLDKLTVLREITRSSANLDTIKPLLLLPKDKQILEIKNIKNYFVELSNDYLRQKIEL